MDASLRRAALTSIVLCLAAWTLFGLVGRQLAEHSFAAATPPRHAATVQLVAVDRDRGRDAVGGAQAERVTSIRPRSRA